MNLCYKILLHFLVTSGYSLVKNYINSGFGILGFASYYISVCVGMERYLTIHLLATSPCNSSPQIIFLSDSVVGPTAAWGQQAASCPEAPLQHLGTLRGERATKPH